MHCGKKWWIREFVAPYIFPLNPDYVAARSLRSLRSNYINAWFSWFSVYLSDSGGSLALYLFCVFIFLDTKTLLTTHLISDRTPNSRYLKLLVNIIGRFKIMHLFETSLDFISLPADVLWGSFVTHSFLPHGRLLNRADFYVLDCLNKPISG